LGFCQIRDLEASVEILSGGKDAALAEMRKLLKGSSSHAVRPPHLLFNMDSDLMAENHTLRGLLRSLSAFIGEGAGGVLPKLGWDLNDFENYVNRAETDTAWESFQKNKRDTKTAQPEASTSQSATNSRKRTTDDASSNRNKRQRSMTAEEDHHTGDIPTLGNSAPANGNMFNGLLRTNPSGSPIFMTAQSTVSQPTYPASGSGNNPFTSAGPGSTPSFLHGLGLESPTSVTTDTVSLSLPPPRNNSTSTTAAETAEENETYDSKMEEAGKLIRSAQMVAFLVYEN
jgi:hypothetical protein